MLFPWIVARLCADLCRFAALALKSRAALAAENLFLRKQLALYEERKAKRCPTSIAFRWTLTALGRLFPWRDPLVIVKADTFLRWHRESFRVFWRWKSRPSGRPALPKNIRILIREMDRENLTWGEERIANELMLKLGIRVSPRTVAKYLDMDRPRRAPDQRWSTFIKNHAEAIVACDFFVSMTATFRILYVFVARSRLGEFSISTSPHTLRLNGQFNSSANPWPSIIRIDS